MCVRGGGGVQGRGVCVEGGGVGGLCEMTLCLSVSNTCSLGRVSASNQRPYIIETMSSYTLPMLCLSGLHLSLLTGGTAVCFHS